MAIPGLETLDGQLLDGLTFCARAYGIFDQIFAGHRGVEELRLLTSKRSKRMVEEILPLAMYVQSRYGPGLRLKVKWIGGNQSYDAYVHSSGGEVEHMALPRRQHIEVTTAVHANDYLVREHLNREGFVFGARGTSRDPKTRTTISAPSVYKNREPQAELVDLISKRIEEKAGKKYPRPTSLIVRCVVGMPILDDEWEYVVRELRNREGKHPFREVILVEHVGRRCTTLHIRRPKRARRSNR